MGYPYDTQPRLSSAHCSPADWIVAYLLCGACLMLPVVLFIVAVFCLPTLPCC